MTTATAEVVIKGRNDLTAAVRGAERDLKGLLNQGELLGKLFRGGAIVGAFIAFERMAEGAQKAAEAIGDKGTARSLKALNKEIDTLKSKGTNLVGQVLGSIYTNFRGTEADKLALDISNLSRELENLRQSAGGRSDLLGPGFQEGVKRLEEMQARAALLGKSLRYGERTRAPGSRGGGTAVSETPWLKEKDVTAKDILDQFDDVVITARQISVGAVEQMYQDMNAATATAIQTQVREWDNLEAQVNELLRAGRISPEDAASRSAEIVGRYFEDIEITADKIFPKSEQDRLSVFAEQAGRNLQDAFATFLFDPFKDGLNGMLAGFLDTIRQMVAQLAAQELLSAFFSWGASAFGGGVGKAFASMGRGLTGRATGGPVTGGTPYMVGERGPELFVPGSSGSIVPNHKMGGGISLAYNIDARGADAERIMAIMPGLLQRTKTETVAEIRNLVARGRM